MGKVRDPLTSGKGTKRDAVLQLAEKKIWD